MQTDWEIKWYDTLDSTNLEAQRILDEGREFANLSVIVTGCQTAGRGQGDHLWHSESLANLTFTVMLAYGRDGICEIRASEQELISMMTALSVVDYLKGKGIEAKIKLPNDIYVGDRKICGILIRHKVRSGLLLDSILGLGINLNQTSFPDNLPNPTSVSLINGKSGYDLHEELCTFLDCLGRRLETLVISRDSIRRDFYPLIREMTSSGLSDLNTADPATSMSAPASTSAPAF